jgi:predicted Zn-dependent peptidase
MKLVFGENGSRKATIRVTIDAGSCVEYPNIWTPGIAHFVEHMIFQGTNELSDSELAKKMAMLGADQNAATWNSKVSFFVTVPAENIFPAAVLLRDMLIDKKFNQEYFDKEKLIILEEESGGRDNVDNSIVEKLYQFLCRGSLSRPIIGTEDSIKSITLDEVQEFYNHYYRSDRMLIVITGPESVNHDEIGELFDTKMNRFRKSKKEKNVHLKTKRRTIYDPRIQQPHLYVCYRAFSKHSKQSLALDTLNQFFASDMDSRLFQSLRQEHGLCYGVHGYPGLQDDLGWYIISTKVAVKNINKSIKLINKEVKMLLKDGPTDEEIIRAKNKFISEIYGYIETSAGLNGIISNQVFGKFPELEETISEIKSMTSKKIINVARKVFKNENKQIFVCLPGEK